MAQKKKAAGAKKPAATRSKGADPFAAAFREELRAPPPAPASNVITLDADIAPHFRSSRAVNEALRALLRIVRQVREPGS